MDERFSEWLGRVFPTRSTWQTRLSDLRRVEQFYGDLDPIYDTDGFDDLLEHLSYTRADERAGEPNPSKIPINGNLRNGLASYKYAVQQYVRFREELAREPAGGSVDGGAETDLRNEVTFTLEKDLQKALRGNIEQLEPGLKVIDEGSEKKVASGFIDILARDARGIEVVIELKAVQAQASVIGQIASYMGDRSAEHGNDVRGIIVAPKFHPKVVSASRIMPVELFEYSFSFRFSPVTP